jgi:hypothetical protein
MAGSIGAKAALRQVVAGAGPCSSGLAGSAGQPSAFPICSRCAVNIPAVL